MVDQVFGHTTTQRALLCKSITQPDFVEACEFTVEDLTVNQQRMATRLIRLHNSYGHAPRATLRRILQQSHIKSDRELARHVDLMPLCNHCLFGKNRKGPKSTLSTSTPSEPRKFLQDVAVDNSGKQNIQSVDGYWIYMIIICRKTNFTWVRFLVSTAESTKEVEMWLREVPKQHLTYAVSTMRHDGGRGDFGNTTFEKLLRKYSITREKTTGASTNNSKVERRIGVATTDSLTQMSWCHGPRNWWTYSIGYSIVNRNMLPTPTNPGHLSPYEFAYDRSPDMSMLVPFGCLAYVAIDNKARKGKTNYRRASRTCAMIGYTLKPDGRTPIGLQVIRL